MPKRTPKKHAPPPPEKYGLWGSTIGLGVGMIGGLIAEMVSGLSMIKMSAFAFGGLAAGALIDGIFYLIRFIKNRRAAAAKARAQKKS